MNNATPRTLEQLVGRPTSYEVIVAVNGETVAVLDYIQRKTKKALLAVMQVNGDALLALADTHGDGSDVIEYVKGSWIIEGSVAVKYSGRTEREARSIMNEGGNNVNS